MIPLAGKLALFWKNDRGDLAHAFQDVIVFDKALSRKAAKERYRG
jgi:hypothetical protein